MALIPVALSESQYAIESFLPRHPTDRTMYYHAWLAFARARGHARAAAEWAAHRLASERLLIIEREATWDLIGKELEREWIAEWVGRVLGNTQAADAWDFTDLKLMLVTSTPQLWEWQRAPAEEESLDLFREGGKAKGKLLTAKHCKSQYAIRGPTLPRAGKADPSIRRDDPDGEGYIYRWAAVQRLITQRQKNRT
jgi:hypothetical protein